MKSTCNILNSFGNKGIYCQAMSGNEYNTAGEPGRGGGGGVGIDGLMFLTPCPVRFVSSLYPRNEVRGYTGITLSVRPSVDARAVR